MRWREEVVEMNEKRKNQPIRQNSNHKYKCGLIQVIDVLRQKSKFQVFYRSVIMIVIHEMDLQLLVVLEMVL